MHNAWELPQLKDETMQKMLRWYRVSFRSKSEIRISGRWMRITQNSQWLRLRSEIPTRWGYLFVRRCLWSFTFINILRRVETYLRSRPGDFSTNCFRKISVETNDFKRSYNCPTDWSNARIVRNIESKNWSSVLEKLCHFDSARIYLEETTFIDRNNWTIKNNSCNV